MSGIILAKGQRVSLAKTDGTALTKVCIGLNWGAIEKSGLLGFGAKKVAVDLDATVGCFSSNGNLNEAISFKKLKSNNGSIVHSGDDLTGDMDGDDGLDNEVITVNLEAVDSATETLAFILNSFNGQDFKDIPFATIRIYEGTPERVDNILATYDIANDSKFAGSVSMIMGKFYRHNGNWKFNAIGEPDNTRRLEETLETVKRSYL